jgi:CubicO group peptidase (beta-lactamase class C family)
MGLSPAIVERVDAVFADMDMPQRPGAALLAIDHDEIVYRKCYGLADLEAQRPITADSSFYLASLSKQFTAMAIMLVAEQRRLSYEDRLLTYFPKFPSWVQRLPFATCSTTHRVCRNIPGVRATSATRPCSNGSWTQQD